MKLLRVVRTQQAYEFVPEGNYNFRRQLPRAVYTTELAPEQKNPAKGGEFFMIDDMDGDVDLFLRALAENNPGCEVQVWSLEQSAQCPAAPMVVKKVTKDGVLPG